MLWWPEHRNQELLIQDNATKSLFDYDSCGPLTNMD